jgi:hypothetical protein
VKRDHFEKALKYISPGNSCTLESCLGRSPDHEDLRKPSDYDFWVFSIWKLALCFLPLTITIPASFPGDNVGDHGDA